MDTCKRTGTQLTQDLALGYSQFLPVNQNHKSSLGRLIVLLC